tara:strand:- start:411 stop:1058 length:648 start_codon:yes stop_codon:yes gene_type:complete
MSDINKYHKDIYQWYLDNVIEHNSITFTTYDEVFLVDEFKDRDDKISYLITAIYVPVDIVKITIYVGDYCPIKIIWCEEEESLESILEQARTLPKSFSYINSSHIDDVNYKRIVLVEPFICIPFNEGFTICYGEDNLINTYTIECCKIPIYEYMPFPYNNEDESSHPIFGELMEDNDDITTYNAGMVDFLIGADVNTDSLADRDEELLESLKLQI